MPKALPGSETRKPDDYEFYLETILEAPRGQRQIWNGGEYIPAWKTGPSANIYPCAGGNCGAAGRTGRRVCGRQVRGPAATGRAAMAPAGQLPAPRAADRVKADPMDRRPPPSLLDPVEAGAQDGGVAQEVVESRIVSGGRSGSGPTGPD